MNKSIQEYFKEIEDPRTGRNVQHLLIDIIILSILAVLSGAEGYEEIELYGNCRIDFLKQYLKLPKGIPSHDTIRRVFIFMDPDSFGKAFMEWTKSERVKTTREIIPIDGKTIRRSKDGFHGKSAIHMVSAWASDNQMVLGQLKVDEKSNEIKVIPELLELLDLENTIVTIDAMGTQTAIAQKIRKKKADYILGLKGNQSYLKELAESLFNHVKPTATHETLEKDHGRIETRKCSVIDDLKWIDEEKENWMDLRSIVKVEATTQIKEIITKETRYYITSVEPDAELLNSAIRKHWGIENKLHWSLDMTFREDESRKRAGNAAENFSTIRKIALNILKKDTSHKLGMKGKRLNAAWNDDYLRRILNI